MRAAVLFVAVGWACAQVPDPAYESLTGAYDALRAHNYDHAVGGFLKAIDAAPRRADIRKDLAYTYLKIGENEQAREQFQEALRLAPDDLQLALDYAFLCYETKQQAEARRIFDRLRKTGNPVAEQAFQNIDAPLAEGIARWREAIEMGADSFSDHFELATLAEQHDELDLAAEHYEQAWRLLPDRRSVLVALGRVWKQLNRLDDANAALLAASRGGEPRAAEMARELLPDRYPFVAEFRTALELDPANVDLRRELGFLLLRMNRSLDAEPEFRFNTESASDLLSTTQLGFLLYARGQAEEAQPLFNRVLAGSDEDLANRVRAVLRVNQVLEPRPGATAGLLEAKLMAERSFKAGYLKDALKYLMLAHESDPDDLGVMLQVGWTYNMLHQDNYAVRWFDLARRGTDPQIATEATRAWRNLRAGTARFRTTGWLFPLFSTRWQDLFSYGQIKTDVRTGWPLRPYVSVRFIGDTRKTMGNAIAPQYLSESSFILGVGIATAVWHGIMGWAEAGSAMSYLTGHKLPDYRGGLSMARNFGTQLGGSRSGWFVASTTDGVFLSRFGNDFLVYEQTRSGYTVGPAAFRIQLQCNLNLTIDSKRQRWANFIEAGPGIRFRAASLPESLFFTVDVMRGAYLIRDPAESPRFRDFRAGIWYAFTH